VRGTSQRDAQPDRARRWAISGTSGGTVWLTGLPAAGKSTIAAALEERLLADGALAYRLDGDAVREGLSHDLGFDRRSRAEQARRVAWAAAVVADAGAVAIVSLVSPYAADRQAARELHERAGLPFVEVFVDTPLAECMRRDPDGLYARATAGELSHVTGVNDPYEPPVAPELALVPAERPLDELIGEVLQAMRSARVGRA
jgi:adenylyl-sulfate kinase